MKQSGFIKTILFVAIGALIGYFGNKYYLNNKSANLATILPSPTVQVQKTDKKPDEGTVSGKLCFPSSFLPPGEIAAKDILTGKLHSQNYIGSTAGGALTYSFKLPVGTYHLRYQAHASTKDTSIFTSGYYTDCAKTMNTVDCTPDSGHIQIDVAVKSNEETKSVDLCDFYYNPTQMSALDKSF